MSLRWLRLGNRAASLGSALAISYLIYTKQANETFWQWPGIIGLVLAALGFVSVIAGRLLRGPSRAPSLAQRGGSNSVNSQAARDITFHKNSESDPT